MMIKDYGSYHIAKIRSFQFMPPISHGL